MNVPAVCLLCGDMLLFIPLRGWVHGARLHAPRCSKRKTGIPDPANCDRCLKDQHVALPPSEITEAELLQ